LILIGLCIDFQCPLTNATLLQQSVPLPTPNDKLDIENRLGDYFVFLRRLISRSPMGKFLSKPHWVKLILSFLSVKPCSDIETLLKLNDEDDKQLDSQSSYGTTPPGSSPGPSSRPSDSAEGLKAHILARELNLETNKNVNSSGITGLEMSKNILFTPGLRPRLLAVQLLDALLTNVPKESSDLQEQVSGIQHSLELYVTAVLIYIYIFDSTRLPKTSFSSSPIPCGQSQFTRELKGIS